MAKQNRARKESKKVAWQNVYVPKEVKSRLGSGGYTETMEMTAMLIAILQVAETVMVKQQEDGTFKAFIFWVLEDHPGVTFALSQVAKHPENALFAAIWSVADELEYGQAVEVDAGVLGLEDDDF